MSHVDAESGAPPWDEDLPAEEVVERDPNTDDMFAPASAGVTSPASAGVTSPAPAPAPTPDADPLVTPTNAAAPAPAPTPTPEQGAAYQVLARKYRPRTFEDLIGQEAMVRTLTNAFATGRIAHAFMLTGVRGVGKTTTARLLARALNNETDAIDRPSLALSPEGRHDAAIMAGQHMDVMEMDAASHTGVGDIREILDSVRYAPVEARYKVYVLDEVHMLSTQAFNALLKTLEEPPAHVKFVLCTTEPEKLPITILSRCQRFDFTTVETAAIARRLAQIVEAEGADVSAEALHLIARRAAGSMRDSQSLLEQLLGAAAGPIGVDDVHAVIGTGREERIGAVVAAVAARDAAAALAALDEALAGGADAGGVLDQLVAALRDCLLASVGAAPELMTQGEGLGVDLPAVGRQLGTATVLAMLQILDQALARMRTSGHPAVLAEMAVVRLARLEDLESLAAVVDKIAAGGPVPAAEPRPVPARPAAVATPATPTPAPQPTAGTEREKKNNRPGRAGGRAPRP
ncbi:MAG: DNA polymerase III subunit gamma/tau [Brevundimonas sp.]|uniref:DNA polymerase III subunit gamma/tau n=1 Tax=Brevundimonas sp. TaxID=1871086 RepID=UPI00391F259F